MAHNLDAYRVKDAAEAVEFAFEAARRVRGRDAKEAALVSLGLHASRTVDARPFLEHDGELARRAAKALDAAGSPALALRVALWEADAVGKPAKGADPAVGAYLRAKEWAASGGKRAELGWIRDVPRDAAKRGIVSERLLLLAEAKGEGGRALAVAALEAELAESPTPKAFSRILHAASFSANVEAIARTQEGVGVGASGGASKEVLLDGELLAAALGVERQRSEGRSLLEVTQPLTGGRRGGPAAAHAALLIQLAPRVESAGDHDQAEDMLVQAIGVLGAAHPDGPGWLAAARYLDIGMWPTHAKGISAANAVPGIEASERAYGAAAATRALGRAAPGMAGLLMFDPEDVLALVSKDAAAPLATMIVRETARAAALEPNAGALAEMLERVRALGLRPSWEAYLRGLIADSAAHLTAWRGSLAAWECAEAASGTRGLSRFERAKLSMRAACEFVRASEVKPQQGPWADFLFGGLPRPPAAAEPAIS